MTIISPDEFRTALPAGARIIALDMGAKTIGLATHVVGQETVMPLKTIMRTKFTRDAAALVQVALDYDISGLVIGWPLLPNGQPGKRCQSVRDFTHELDRFLAGNHKSILITFHDERFSTAHGDDMVDNIGKTAGKSVRNRRNAIIDALAAQKILEDFVGG
jgi:putative holliday junction resolvase